MVSSDELVAHAAAADSAALAAAAGSAEEALACQRDALAVLADGWRSETGSAATALLQQRCAEATDIVAALHRAAEELRLLGQDWTDLTRGPQETVRTDGAPPGDHLMGETPNRPDSAAPPAGVCGEPASAGPWPVQGWSAQAWPEPMGAGPWAKAPTTAAAPVPTWPSGGSGPAGVGGALLGLVAQIAQSLGSYADSPVNPDAETSADNPDAADSSLPQRNPAAVDSGPPGEGVPNRAVPQSLPTMQDPLPELLAAERPPDPGASPAPPPQPPVDTPALATAPPIDPVAAEPAPAEAVPLPAGDARAPCEIAADGLAKVGE